MEPEGAAAGVVLAAVGIGASEGVGGQGDSVGEAAGVEVGDGARGVGLFGEEEGDDVGAGVEAAGGADLGEGLVEEGFEGGAGGADAGGEVGVFEGEEGVVEGVWVHGSELLVEGDAGGFVLGVVEGPGAKVVGIFDWGRAEVGPGDMILGYLESYGLVRAAVVAAVADKDGRPWSVAEREIGHGPVRVRAFENPMGGEWDAMAVPHPGAGAFADDAVGGFVLGDDVGDRAGVDAGEDEGLPVAVDELEREDVMGFFGHDSGFG